MKGMRTLFALALLTLSALFCSCDNSVNWVFPNTGFTELPVADPRDYSMAAATSDWYKDEIFYHLWISGFNDGPDADTECDIPGILARLDYLKNDLGVTAIWLSPFFNSTSPANNRHNYDVIDHYKVHPAIGTNEDLQELIYQIHQRGMRVILEWIPNHVSDQHPWFTESQNPESPMRDWFTWRSTQPEGWTGWDQISDFHGPVNNTYYYGFYWSGMPDLNYLNQSVRDTMGTAIIHWLNAGFDGMCVNGVKYLYEDWSVQDAYHDQPQSIDHFQKIRSEILEPYSAKDDGTGKFYHKFMVAENWDSNPNSIISYIYSFGRRGFHMTLDFQFAEAANTLNMNDIHNHWQWVKGLIEPMGGWMGLITTNHDNLASRPMSNFLGDTGKVRAQAALLLTGVGTPFIYYGNEIGMSGLKGDDTNLRTRFEWNRIEGQKSDPGSLLNWHRALTELRKMRISLRRGSYTLIRNDAGIFAFEREYQGQRTLIVLNLSPAVQSPALTLTKTPASAVTLFGTDSSSMDGTTITLQSMQGYAVRAIALETGATASSLISDIPYTAP